MNDLRLVENEYGFYIDYVFKDKSNKKCLRISVDNDYFSFSIFSPYEEIENIQKIDIDSTNQLFPFVKHLLENNSCVEILEEGTEEGKSIIFKDDKNSVSIIFKLTDIPTNVASVSFTNIRLASPNVTFGNGSPVISNFKNKLHSLLVDLKGDLYGENRNKL